MSDYATPLSSYLESRSSDSVGIVFFTFHFISPRENTQLRGD